MLEKLKICIEEFYRYEKSFLVDQFFELALIDDLKLFNEYLSKNSYFLSNEDRLGNTRIHYCFAFNENLEIIKSLVERKKYLLKKTNLDGNNPFHLCMAFNQNIHIIKYMIEDLHNDPKKMNSCGNGAFQLACMKNENLEIIKYLVEEKKCDVYVKDKFGITPIHHAFSKNGNLEILKYFVEEREINIEIDDYSSDDLLTYCCGNSNNLQNLKYLLTLKDWQINSTKKNGKTLIHYLSNCAVDNLEVIKFFVKERNLKVNVVDTYGCNPLHYAFNHTFFNRIKFLVENKCDLNQLDNDGNTPLHMFADYMAYTKQPRTRLYFLSILFFSVSCGGNFEVKYKQNETPKKFILRIDDDFKPFFEMVERRNIWKKENYNYFPSHIQTKIFNFLACLKYASFLTKYTKPPKNVVDIINGYFVSFTVFPSLNKESDIKKRQPNEEDDFTIESEKKALKRTKTL